MSIYMFNTQISAISYRFVENSLYVSVYTVVVVVIIVVFSEFVSFAWPTACLFRERSSIIAIHFGYV